MADNSYHDDLSDREKNVVAAMRRHCPQGRVLDFPCGKGYLSGFLADEGYDVVAADIDRDIFEPEDITWEKADLDADFAFEDSSFDIVCCVAGMEHTESPYHVAREMRRVLRPGGYLMLQVPNFSNLMRRMRFVITGRLTKRPPRLVRDDEQKTGSDHLAAYPLEQYRHVLQTVCFDVVELDTFRLARKTAAWWTPFWAPLAAGAWVLNHTIRRDNPVTSLRPDRMLNREALFVARKPRAEVAD